jgi:hypothetical protein
MKRKPQTQSRNNVSTLMTKLNQLGRQNLDRLRVLTEDYLDMPVSNAVLLQRGLQLYVDEFSKYLIRIPPENDGKETQYDWKVTERLNLIKTAEGTTTKDDIKEASETE